MFYQGEDIIFDLSITYDDGTTVDLSTTSDIVLYFYNLSSKDRVIKMSKLTRDGYIKMTQSSTTVYRGIIDSSITKLLTCGTYVVEINIKSSDSELSDSELNRIGAQEAFYLEHCEIKNDSNLTVS